MNEHKEKIIEALKSGVSLRRISREFNIPASTLSKYFRKDDDYKMALEYHKTLVDNLFS